MVTIARAALATLAAAALPLMAGCRPGGDESTAARPPELAAPAALWSDPPAALGAVGASLTAGSTGVWLTWLERGSDAEPAHTLRVAALRGSSWSPPATVAAADDFFANWADFPALAESADGVLWVHWLAKIAADPYSYAIRLAQSQDAGRTWQQAGTLHDDTVAAEHGFVSYAAAPGAVDPLLRAFWLDGRDMPGGAPMGLRTRLLGAREPAGYPESRPPAGAEELLDERVCECCQTGAAWTADGPLVAYRDRSPDEVRDIYVVRATAAGWSEPRPVAVDGWRIAGCPVNGPAVAADERAVAVGWTTGAGDTGAVKVAFSADSGASFGAPVIVDGDRPAGRVDLALEPSGSAIVSWLAATPEGGEVRLCRVAPDGSLGAPLTVGRTSSGRGSGFPRIALHRDRLAVVWLEVGDDPARGRLRVADLLLSDLPAIR